MMYSLRMAHWSVRLTPTLKLRLSLTREQKLCLGKGRWFRVAKRHGPQNLLEINILDKDGCHINCCIVQYYLPVFGGSISIQRSKWLPALKIFSYSCIVLSKPLIRCKLDSSRIVTELALLWDGFFDFK